MGNPFVPAIILFQTLHGDGVIGHAGFVEVAAVFRVGLLGFRRLLTCVFCLRFGAIGLPPREDTACDGQKR